MFKPLKKKIPDHNSSKVVLKCVNSVKEYTLLLPYLKF